MDNDSFSVDHNSIGQNSAGRGGIDFFSAEERAEINARIEAVSSREAVTAPGLPSKKEAARRGLFPFLVNAGALLLLTAGIFLLLNFQQTDAAEIRESGAAPGLTERALIREIRSEANFLLTEKDTAIDAMNRRIEEVDGELKRLETLETLTDEQRIAMDKLTSQQEAYRKDLAELQIDKAQILTNARIREAEARTREENLHAQLREQRGMIQGLSAQNRTDIENARSELAHLSDEAEKTNFIEKQLSGFYSNIYRQIESRQYREAAGSIAALKEYLATPSFTSIKVIQARRESDAASMETLSILLEKAQETGGISAVSVQAEISSDTGAEDALKKQVEDQRASIEKQNASIAEQNTALAELKKNIVELQGQNNTFSETLAERESQIEDLKAQNASHLRNIETLQKTISNATAALENRE